MGEIAWGYQDNISEDYEVHLWHGHKDGWHSACEQFHATRIVAYSQRIEYRPHWPPNEFQCPKCLQLAVAQQ